MLNGRPAGSVTTTGEGIKQVRSTSDALALQVLIHLAQARVFAADLSHIIDAERLCDERISQ